MNRSAQFSYRKKSSPFETNRKPKLARCISVVAAIGMTFVSIATMCQPALPFETPSIVPANGPSAGGTEVTIIGTKFSESSAVLFGDQAASSFTIVNENVIQAVTPAHPAGAVDVVIIDDRDRVQLFASAYTFEDPPVEPAPAPTPLTVALVDLPNGPRRRWIHRHDRGIGIFSRDQRLLRRHAGNRSHILQQPTAECPCPGGPGGPRGPSRHQSQWR